MSKNKIVQGMILCVSGPSGVGKGTVIEAFMKRREDFSLSISMTTRKPRGQEQDGVEYYFCNKEKFQELIREKEILEFDIYSDEYYGTPVGPIREYVRNQQNVILDITIDGAIQVKKIFPQAVMVFLLPPAISTLRERLLKRSTESESEIETRIKQAEIEISQAKKFEYAILNDRIDDTVARLEAIVLAEESKFDRQASQFAHLFKMIE